VPMKVRFFSFFLMIMTLASCAGYHFNTSNNPLIGYDIRSVAVPMFINQSVIPDLAASMTKEITFVLNDYPGLRIYSGNDEKADAVLIGIIQSKNHYNEVVTTTQSLFTDDHVKASVGNRNPFYYPVRTAYVLNLKVILIKRPTPEEIQLLTTDLGKYFSANPKVVLVDDIPLNGTFSRVVAENKTTNSAGSVNFVKNKGIFEKSLQETCLQAAQTFKQVVLNAF
jgi:hypothetical protein